MTFTTEFSVRAKHEDAPMAASDYKLCDLCNRKAFYDADISDSHYVATYDSRQPAKPVGIAVLCADCNLTHEAIIRPRRAD